MCMQQIGFLNQDYRSSVNNRRVPQKGTQAATCVSHRGWGTQKEARWSWEAKDGDRRLWDCTHASSCDDDDQPVRRPFKPSKLAIEARPTIAQRMHRRSLDPPFPRCRMTAGVGGPTVAQGGRIRRDVVVAETGSGVVLYSALLMLLIRFRRELLLRQCYRRPRRSDRFARGFRIRCNLISGETLYWNQEDGGSASLCGVSEWVLVSITSYFVSKWNTRKRIYRVPMRLGTFIKTGYK